jgi:tRNA 2-thiouridine synthesizing protein A
MPLLDVTGKKCPIPVIKTRKAVLEMREGDILEIIGDYEDSKGEVLLAIKELGLELLEVREGEGKWKVCAKK